MRISLIPIDGGHPYVIDAPIVLVGRSAECDYCLDDDGVAETHCVLVPADGLLLLRDLATGTIRVNGQRVQRAVMVNDDQLTIGTVSFRVRYER